MSANFYIPPKERLGFLLLILLIVAGHSMYLLYEKIAGYSEKERLQILSEILDNENKNNHEFTNETDKAGSVTTVPISNLSPFDPNTISVAQLATYGIPTYASNNLDKYRNRGGRIKNIDGFYRIYGMDSSVVEPIKHLIRFSNIPNQKENEPPLQSQRRTANTETIEDRQDSINSSLTNNKILGNFNPNTASLQTLKDHGFSTYAANNLVKYRSNGGLIQRDSDLLKIYGFDTSSFQNITSLMFIPHSIDESAKEEFNNIEEPSIKKINAEEDSAPIYLNTATAEALVKLKGVGPVISKGIIAYRDKLGGYRDIQQLKEVYAITPELFESIQSRFIIDKDIKRIYIPSLSFKELVTHPYIDFETTKLVKKISIINFDEELEKLIINGRLDSRLIPYLYLSDPGLDD